MRARIVVLAVATSAATASADRPSTPSSSPPASSPSSSRAADPDPAPAPLTRVPSAAPFLVFDPPPPPPPSLRIEALRIAGERAENDWRFPTPEPVFGWQENGFFIGWGHYRPRTARSAALHGGAIASTLLGQMLLDTVPVAGVGLFAAGATLDAAAADVDRDAESRRPR